jgi:2'-5' RNA ligase
MRLFLGIPVPQRIAEGLLHHARGLKLASRDSGKGLRFTAPENMHLTLVFLGEVAEEKLSAIAAELGAVAVPNLNLHLSGLGTFSRAGVLFAVVEFTPALLRLQADVAQRMAHIGFKLENRAYYPHLTLARGHSAFRLKPAQRALPQSVPRSFSVNEIILYRSQPTPDGSRYEPLIRRAAVG